MAKSLIQTANQSPQTVAVDGIISLGTTIRRYGCGLRLVGNGIEIQGDGYYEFVGSVSVAPTEAGEVTVALYENGVQIPGAIATATAAAAEDSVALPLVTTIRRPCCAGASTVTCVLLAGAGTVSNISLKGVRS